MRGLLFATGLPLFRGCFAEPKVACWIGFDPLTFCWLAFRSGWGAEAMISEDARLLSLDEAKKELQRGAICVYPAGCGFEEIRRCRGIHAEAFDAATARMTAGSGDLVVVISAVAIDAEWRFFIVDGEIVDCSGYIRRWVRPSMDGSVPNHAIEWAAKAAKRWGPAAVYCLDLAACGERIGIVEANCFNGSRFYAAGVGRIVEAVGGYARTAWLRGR